MSGHSKWATIKHQKGAKDTKRGQLFAKLIRAVEVAARVGGPSAEGNAALADAMQKARDNSVPNETIERAVKRGAGEIEGPAPELVAYEGYAPGGVAVLVECLTGNRNRTAADVRHVFARNGGSMADAGSVAYLFSRQGQLVVDRDGVDEDRLMEVALDAGAEDVRDDGGSLLVVTPPSQLRAVRGAFDAAGMGYESAQVTMAPSLSVPVDRNEAAKVLRLIDALEDLDDVQDVYANFDIPDDVLAELAPA